jgi:hypothetical protein
MPVNFKVKALKNREHTQLGVRITTPRVRIAAKKLQNVYITGRQLSTC